MSVSMDWLKAYFSRTSSLPENAEDENYFNIGLIDSFGIIELIEAVEQEFGVKFNETHFQDRRFSTIRGLAEIIEELRNG